jgi:thiosulfate/3-mercaptopyruvate sulfurtransferase
MSLNRSAIAILFVLIFLNGAVRAAPVMVDTQWVAKNMARPGVVLIDMAADETQYDRFHIPGAIYLPYYAIVKARKKDRVTLPLTGAEFRQILGKFGLSSSQHFVIYDDMGGLNAARLFWQLEGIGHKNVSVMNGGLVKWILEGRKVVNKPARLKPVAYGTSRNGRNNLATMKDVDNAVKNGVTLIDARSDEEYIGDLKKRKGGHVPGAKWWEWSRSIDISRGFIHRPDSKLQSELVSIGAGEKNKPVIAYCRSGHRAAQTYLTLRSLGYEDVKLYAQSMKEYGLYRAKNLKRGMQP